MSLQFVYFFIGFVTILLAFIYFIVYVARTLSGNVSRQTYDFIERVLIAGILLGVVGMFQPWAQVGYRIGFYVLLFSTLGFIVWSHVTPQGAHPEE